MTPARLKEIEALPRKPVVVPSEAPSHDVLVWMKDAADAIPELVAEVKRLQAKLEFYGPGQDGCEHEP